MFLFSAKDNGQAGSQKGTARKKIRNAWNVTVMRRTNAWNCYQNIHLLCGTSLIFSFCGVFEKSGGDKQW